MRDLQTRACGTLANGSPQQTRRNNWRESSVAKLNNDAATKSGHQLRRPADLKLDWRTCRSNSGVNSPFAVVRIQSGRNHLICVVAGKQYALPFVRRHDCAAATDFERSDDSTTN